jgi:uncharacterized SAM-binding protein YcdF (DUF218 family)
MTQYDAVIIPGGGVRPGGELPAWVKPRLDRALELAGDAWLMPLSAGTPHRPPPLDARGFPILEARAGADYLVSRGADPRHILMETASYDTIGNAYFSRVIHAIPRGFRRALVITSEFHMARTEAAFRWIWEMPAPGGACPLEFQSVPDEGHDAKMLALRQEKERSGLVVLESLRQRIRTFSELHRWIFAEHGVYSAVRRVEDGVDARMY